MTILISIKFYGHHITSVEIPKTSANTFVGAFYSLLIKSQKLLE